MNNFRRFALLTTVATYFLIFVGGLVRVAGAGLGCPDWPKCFGRWIPPFSVDQIPDHIDASSFNVVLAWIEYTNRLAGMSIGILILITAILAFRHYRTNQRVLYPSLAAAVLVAFEGWQGSIVVATELQPLVVTVHMVLALVIVSLLLFATLESHRVSPRIALETVSFPRYTRAVVGALWGLTMLQIIAGSQVRQALEVAVERFPLLAAPEWLIEAGSIVEIHSLGGLLVAALTFYVALNLLRSEGRRLAIVRIPAISLILIVLCQVLLGSLLQILELSPLAKNFHLWLATLMVSVQFILFSAVKTPTGFKAGWKRSIASLAGMTAVMIIVLSLAAYGIIGKAARSLEDIPVLASYPELTVASMEQNISVVGFVRLRSRDATEQVMQEMRDLYIQYEHSNIVHFVVVELDQGADTLLTLADYLNESSMDTARWSLVVPDSTQQAELFGRGSDAGNRLGECCDRLALIDAVGNIRGYYDFASVPAMRKFKTDIRVLALNLR